MLKEYIRLLHTFNNENLYKNKETFLAARKKTQKYMENQNINIMREICWFLEKHNFKHFFSFFPRGNVGLEKVA